MVGKGYGRSVKKVEEVQEEKKGSLFLGIRTLMSKRWGEGWVGKGTGKGPKSR